MTTPLSFLLFDKYSEIFWESYIGFYFISHVAICRHKDNLVAFTNIDWCD